MVASDSFAEFLRKQLALLGRLAMRRMFGKTGVFRDGVMFGMVADNMLYFRVDDDNRRSSTKASPLRPSTTRRRAPPQTSRFSACRTGCSTSPMSLSARRERHWRRRGGSPRRENGQHQGKTSRKGRLSTPPPERRPIAQDFACDQHARSVEAAAIILAKGD